MQLIYTTSKSKKKPNRKPGWRQAEEDHRQWLIKMGVDPDAKPKKREFVPYTQPKPANYRETPHIPSLGDGVGGWAPKKESIKYTGTFIKGIATMHKSNAVPVINDEQAKDISAMGK